MERIKEALERAREERQRHGGHAGMSPVFAPVEVPSHGITYTQTRSETVSDALLREKRVVTAMGHDGPYVDAYKILRTRVLQQLREKHWNTLAVTSSGDGEGKTLTAINLAISLAGEVSQTVLLVDADLRHPSVHTYFGIPNARGLSDYLTGDVPVQDILFNPAGISGFVVLPGGRALPNSSEMLNSPKMVRLVEELKSRYASRIVIFDLPPLLTAADALSFAPYVDAALLVIEEGKTQAEEMRYAAELLARTNLIGTVLNKSLERPRSDGIDDDAVPRALSAAGSRIGRFARRLFKRKPVAGNR
jgi:capsular exopolysaccharide synthesis family protein